VAPPAGRRRRRIRWRRHVEGYLVIAPWLLGFLAFIAGPMIASAYLSLTRYDMLTPPRWLGVANFEAMTNDDLLPVAVFNTSYYTVFAVPLQVVVALLLALLLNQRLRGIGFFRTVFYLPTVTPTVASVILWVWIYNPDFGIANGVLRFFGLPPQTWLADPALAKPSLILMSLWHIGSQMVIFLAGLQSVPAALYDAAAIDGGNEAQQFVHVTLPMLSPVIFFNLVLGIIGSFQVFTAAYIATSGGPVNATYFYLLHLYDQAFGSFRMGYASALASALFAMILAFAIAQFRLGRRWVYYEMSEHR